MEALRYPHEQKLARATAADYRYSAQRIPEGASMPGLADGEADGTNTPAALGGLAAMY